jgi:mercuric ion transport protein
MAIHERLPISPPVSIKVSSGVFAAVGAALGLGAVFASSCCAVPLLLSGLGAGAGMFSVLEAMSSFRTPLLVLGTLTVVGGWWMWQRKRGASCEANAACAPARCAVVPVVLLSVATLLVVIAAAWDYIEPVLLHLMRIA